MFGDREGVEVLLYLLILSGVHAVLAAVVAGADVWRWGVALLPLVVSLAMVRSRRWVWPVIGGVVLAVCFGFCWFGAGMRVHMRPWDVGSWVALSACLVCVEEAIRYGYGVRHEIMTGFAIASQDSPELLRGFHRAASLAMAGCVLPLILLCFYLSQAAALLLCVAVLVAAMLGIAIWRATVGRGIVRRVARQEERWRAEAVRQEEIGRL